MWITIWRRYCDFLPEDAIATALAAADCDHALDTLMIAVHRHTGGHGHDDMALFLLEHGTPSRSSANGHPAAQALLAYCAIVEAPLRLPEYGN